MRILALVDYEAVPADDPAIEGRTEEIRASMECHVLGAIRKLGHERLASLAEANCLVIVPDEVAEVKVGERVDVAFLAQRG